MKSLDVKSGRKMKLRTTRGQTTQAAGVLAKDWGLDHPLFVV
jgi:hypothetical protein